LPATATPQLNVYCNNVYGIFSLPELKILCCCWHCERLSTSKRMMTPTQFEQHGGLGAAKKWRISIK
jgi:hypothetical protein